jgi:hypothetical protein
MRQTTGLGVQVHLRDEATTIRARQFPHVGGPSGFAVLEIENGATSVEFFAHNKARLVEIFLQAVAALDEVRPGADTSGVVGAEGTVVRDASGSVKA